MVENWKSEIRPGASRFRHSCQLHKTQAVRPALTALKVALPGPLPVGQPSICICKAVLPNY